MTNRRASLVLASILAVGLFAFAFVAAPKSCEWGLTAYFWSGVAVVLVLVVAPFILRRADTVWIRIRTAFLFGILGFAVWIAGLYAADVQILCRLF